MNLKQMIAAFLANLLERAFGSKPNLLLTVTGGVGALAAGLAAFPVSIVPPKYQPWLVGAAGVLALTAGALGQGQKSQQPAAKE